MKRTERIKVDYPRRRVWRGFLRQVVRALFAILADVQVVGEENLPDEGPLLVVANHFSFIDPVAVIAATPWPLEFIGGFRMPNAPTWTTWLPQLWGYLPVYRGTTSVDALRMAEHVLKQDGILGIFPEAGSWADVLRPARPGTAFLAARTEARILPIGLSGLNDVFPALGEGRRARVTLRIGKPFGPFKAGGRGRERRRKLDRIGDSIMNHIAELIPPEKRGLYSEDKTLREAAEKVADYPWADKPDYIDERK